jgi:hypothetical protein
VTWSSSDATKATISNAGGTNGKATTVAAGTTTITATQGGVSGSTTLIVSSAALVSIEVTPDDPTILVGNSIQFTATGTYSDSSTQDLTSLVNWTSFSPAFATVSNSAGSKGLAVGVAAGTATISASSGVINDSSNLEVD